MQTNYGALLVVHYRNVLSYYNGSLAYANSRNVHYYVQLCQSLASVSVSFLTTHGLSDKTDCYLQMVLIEVSKYEKHAASVYNISKRDRK